MTVNIVISENSLENLRTVNYEKYNAMLERNLAENPNAFWNHVKHKKDARNHSNRKYFSKKHEVNKN